MSIMQLTVLVTDDDPDARFCARTHLEDLDFLVIEAADGYAAVKIAQTTRVDFAFLDFNMPGMTGVETLNALRKVIPDLRAILCSGSTEDDCLHGSKIKGLVYLPKPYDRIGILNAMLTVFRTSVR